MLVKYANEADIFAALEVANWKYEGNLIMKEFEDVSGPRVSRHKVRLTVKDLEGPGCRRGFLSYAYGHTNAPRRIRSACYHAVGAWMVALFERVPDAVIESGSMHLQGGRYKGAAGFLREYQSVGENNIGSQIYPIAFRDACNCWEHDTDIIDTTTLQYLGFETHVPGASA